MSTKTNSTQILEEHKIRKTQTRDLVLNCFLQSDVALSHHALETKLPKSVDRITLYRTLNKFVEHGVLHKIENAGQTHFALCHSCDTHKHTDNHIHFQCVSCSSIQCIHQDEEVNYKLPQGFFVEQVEVLVKGICRSCSQQENEISE